jgi:glycosidase
MENVPVKYRPRTDVRVRHPQWTRDAVIYQINTRQFTDEGTFRAAEAHLPRLRELGVSILWLMPVHPIGEEKRKGVLGSPYAVRDYYGVNPELGGLGDLQHFVESAHEHGLKVILDWVANHTAWDNPLVEEHPDWYARDRRGALRPTPWWDWDDIIDLDYSSPALRQYMTEAMVHWVRTADVDGFRCDVAGFVPNDFWEIARDELEAVKPVFMLAEWEARDLHVAAFDASYAWSWNEALHRIANGTGDLEGLRAYYAWNENAYPPDCFRMTFVSNHDMNAWAGTEFEQFGPALEAAIVLSVIGEGIPMIYNGQEAGNDRRLSFFDRDPIVWRAHPLGDMYRSLFALKRDKSVLWNGAWGARMTQVVNDQPDHVFSFARQDGNGAVLAVLNLSDQERTVRLQGTEHTGRYTDHFTGTPEDVDDGWKVRLEPWGYCLLLQ